MKAVIQRVRNASVLVKEESIAEINKGLLIFIGIQEGDSKVDCEYLFNKIRNLKLFEAEGTHFGKSLEETQSDVLLVSQFTLLANTNEIMPTFYKAAKPSKAKELYELLVNTFKTIYPGKTQAGLFASYMDVKLTNDGPLTIIIDSKEN